MQDAILRIIPCDHGDRREYRRAIAWQRRRVDDLKRGSSGRVDPGVEYLRVDEICGTVDVIGSLPADDLANGWVSQNKIDVACHHRFIHIEPNRRISVEVEAEHIRALVANCKCGACYENKNGQRYS